MELQRIFKNPYLKQLRDNIIVDDYRKEEFPYDDTQTKALANVYKPEGLLEKLDPTDDFKTAKALYEAYKDVSPLVASLPNLWVYLTHVDLFQYVQKRWPKIYEKEVDEKYIVNHWHENDHFMRTTFAGLWWHTYLSYDESRDDPYELTEILFKSQDFRTLRFGELGLIRHRPAMQGVLEFLLENPDVIENAFDARGQFISRYFNMLGGIKPLAYMEKEYFKKVLTDIKPSLLNIKSINDVQNKQITM